jgi:catechol 2,3-dioxygenase-like lactoylglutathione lyase family enzyme
MAEADWPGGISAITVFVEDLDACRAFYAEVFGVDPIFSDDQSSAYRFGATIVNLLDVRAADELVAPAKPGDLGGPRYVLTVSVGDVDATCAELAGRGVTLLNGPMDRPWGPRTASFVDPAGQVWEIAS